MACNLQLREAKLGMRPTEELAKRLAVGSLRESMAGDDQGRIAVRVDAGDILLVDTRQWWHTRAAVHSRGPRAALPRS